MRKKTPTRNKNKLPLTRKQVGHNLIERYTGSPISHFQPYILLTNTKQYVDLFAKLFKLKTTEGSAMGACHNKSRGITIINYGVGSPVAALIAELLSFIKPKATIMLGLCGGLRNNYKEGDYFNPVAAIRDEGTSEAFMPHRCPSLSSFVIQRYICEELERHNKKYHNGVIHTTNVRFWEFKEEFKKRLREEKAQVIDMECATIFTVGFAYKIAIGALMLITDMPLKPSGIKTKGSAKKVFDKYAKEHIKIGVNTLIKMQKAEKTDGLPYKF